MAEKILQHRKTYKMDRTCTNFQNLGPMSSPVRLGVGYNMCQKHLMSVGNII